MVQVYFLASAKLQKELIKQGKDAKKLQRIDVDSPSLLEHATVTKSGLAIINLTDMGNYEQRNRDTFGEYIPQTKTTKYLVAQKHAGYWENNVAINQAYVAEEKATPEFDAIPTEKELLTILADTEPDLSAQLKEKQTELDADFEKRKAEYLERKEHQEKDQKEREERDAAKKAEQKRIEDERAAWIHQYGSERLKLMAKSNYELRQTYEIERGAIEIPDAEIDANGDKFRWNERANPSLEALKMNEELAVNQKYEVGIVWVTDDQGDLSPEDRYYEDPPEAYEAIAIKPEWSRYHFIMKI